MEANKTVTINGRVYDAVTGLPVETKAKKPTVKTPILKPAEVKRAAQVPSTAVHSTTQRSQTLHRRATKKPGLAKRPKPGQHMDISRSSKVGRFAPHPIAAPVKKVAETPDVMPKTHPLVAKAMARVPKPAPVLTSKEVKEAAVAAAISKTPLNREAKEERTGFRFSKRFTIISASFIVLILSAALIYFNIPSLSVSFASSQAGINATYPEYQPDGFHLDQPVTFSDGEVTLKFASNSNDTGYVITQTRSSWDSSAVLDNVVRKKAGDNYVTTQERGLTIYSFDTTAVWVNGGLLYKIVSTAPLSGEQIRHIATSL